MRSYCLIVALALAACSKAPRLVTEPDAKASEPDARSSETTHAYTLDVRGDGARKPPVQVKVSITIPSSWEIVDELVPESVYFFPPGVNEGDESVNKIVLTVFACLDGSDPTACMDTIMGRNFSPERLRASTVEQLGGDRRFLKYDWPGDRRRVNAALFAHHPGSGAVVMCSFGLRDGYVDRLFPAARAVCESLTF